MPPSGRGYTGWLPTLATYKSSHNSWKVPGTRNFGLDDCGFAPLEQSAFFQVTWSGRAPRRNTSGRWNRSRRGFARSSGAARRRCYDWRGTRPRIGSSSSRSDLVPSGVRSQVWLCHRSDGRSGEDIVRAGIIDLNGEYLSTTKKFRCNDLTYIGVIDARIRIRISTRKRNKFVCTSNRNLTASDIHLGARGVKLSSSHGHGKMKRDDFVSNEVLARCKAIRNISRVRFAVH